MESRSKDSYKVTLYEYLKDILVECPACKHQALVDTRGYTLFQYEAKDVRLVCTHCGHNKMTELTPTRKIAYTIGGPVDPFFQLPVWLQTDVGEHLLWAYNEAHLNLLEAHVKAKLRERNGFKYKVESIGAKLPRWMTSAKNREQVLKAIERLKNKLNPSKF